MLTRTITTTVSFARPFHVSGIAGMQPAGRYIVETDEELIEALSFVAYRRVSTTIQLPPESGRTSCTETHVIDPAALEAALARDAAGMPPPALAPEPGPRA